MAFWVGFFIIISTIHKGLWESGHMFTMDPSVST